MAYTLQSLITILQKMLNPEQKLWIVDQNKPLLESLLEKATSLQQILDKSPLTKIESLESQIRDAAHEAEDIIESHMVDQMLSNPEAEGLTFTTPDLYQVIQQLDSATEQVAKLEEVKTGSSSGASFSRNVDSVRSKAVVGVDEDLRQLMDRLSADQRKLEMVPIVGMGGIGKTTLARKLYENPYIVCHFQYAHAWTTVSEDYNMKAVLLSLLHCICGKESDHHDGKESHELSGASSSCNVDSIIRSKVVVGVDGDLIQLRDRLTGDNKKLEMVPIVGMGGIGKTTLARKLYEDPSIVSRFQYAHAWTTVSQDYDMKAILLNLLHCISGKESHEHAGKKSDDLKVILYQSLLVRRYMVVLDDIWSITFWDEIRQCFPDNNKGSRIVITTRESGVAKHVSPKNEQHQMQVLNESESWNLLRQEVFGDQEYCPKFLQGIAEKISRDCGGLPLAINVIGGLLAKVERSIGVWESIAKNVASAIAEADEQFYNILSLSYSHLPNHLKPCFLYMGAFPEDHKIEGSKLVRMWMGEGFVNANGNKSLEEEAEGFLKALVERNLIFVSEYEYAKPKSYGMHDLLRDLCIRKSNEDKFLYVGNGRVSNPRRMCVAESFEDNAIADCLPLVRSFIIIGEILVEFEAFRLVRVLDVMGCSFYEFPMEILQLVNLRFLAVYSFSSVPSEISCLKNLQTLSAHTAVSYFTSEIFELSELRHVQLSGVICMDKRDMKRIAPNKLQTISRVEISLSLMRSGFLESILDIKDLSFYCEYTTLTPGSIDLTHLHKLEALTLDMGQLVFTDRLSAFKFPSGLRKLIVSEHWMSPSEMTTLSALPNLEVLKMEDCEFGRDRLEWEVAEGDEFRALQVLHLNCHRLARWKANETNFPRLHHLHLQDCRYLREIPSGIGEIPTLESIELQNCRSAVASARRIVEEQQEDYGNYSLQLRIK